jgi:PAS domain S-box-containing protein
MSLKARLRVAIIGLVAILVFVLSLLNLQAAATVEFQHALARAQATAGQIKIYVLARISERSGQQPPPATLEESKKLWADTIRRDRTLADVLGLANAANRSAVETHIYDENQQVLVSSFPEMSGRAAPRYPPFEQWGHKSLLAKLGEVWLRRQNYSVPVELGVGNERMFTIEVVISSVLLRHVLEPQMRSLGAVWLIGLGLSIIIGALFSDYVIRPISRLSQAIDRIASGEAVPHGAVGTETREFAAVQAKLNVLGAQFRGARQDVTQLRSNIEQLFERLEEAVLLFDDRGRLMMAGRPAERLLGSTRRELLGRTYQEIFPATTQMGEAVEGAIERGCQVRDQQVTLMQEGQPFHALLNVEVLHNHPARQLVGTLITLRDAETRRQIQKELDLSNRLAAISRLTSGVAHEIKNPLNAIALHIELLKNRVAPADSDVEQQIQVITGEIRRLDRVVKTFLDFTRPIQLQLQEVRLAELLDEIVTLVAPDAEQRGVRVHAEYDHSLRALIRGDSDLLKQAFLNVVVNGVEAMSTGGRLELRLSREGSDCVLAISDTGPGIPPEIQDKIFNLYFSTKESGSGIGLAMTFRVVQLHSGTIEVSSEPGKGSTFRLRFPASESVSATQGSAA